MDAVGKRMGVRFEAVKGYHFPSGPYVEYRGNVAAERRVEVKELLQREMDRIIAEHQGVALAVKQMESGLYLDAVAKIEGDRERRAHLDAMHIAEGDTVRVVAVPGFEGAQCSCGGTHIDRIERIRKITITKFKKKNKNLRVSYKVE